MRRFFFWVVVVLVDSRASGDGIGGHRLLLDQAGKDDKVAALREASTSNKASVYTSAVDTAVTSVKVPDGHSTGYGGGGEANKTTPIPKKNNDGAGYADTADNQTKLTESHDAVGYDEPEKSSEAGRNTPKPTSDYSLAPHTLWPKKTAKGGDYQPQEKEYTAESDSTVSGISEPKTLWPKEQNRPENHAEKHTNLLYNGDSFSEPKTQWPKKKSHRGKTKDSNLLEVSATRWPAEGRDDGHRTLWPKKETDAGHHHSVDGGEAGLDDQRELLADGHWNDGHPVPYLLEGEPDDVGDDIETRTYNGTDDSNTTIVVTTVEDESVRWDQDDCHPCEVPTQPPVLAPLYPRDHEEHSPNVTAVIVLWEYLNDNLPPPPSPYEEPTPEVSTPTPETTPLPENMTPAPEKSTPVPDNTPPTDYTPLAPENTTPAPENSTPTPGNTTPAPSNATPAPEGTTIAPGYTTPAPENPTSAPPNATPAPDTTTAAPSPTPVSTTPAPENPTSAPPNTTPAPGSTTSAPGTTTAAPSSTPASSTPAPENAAPTPTPTPASSVTTNPTQPAKTAAPTPSPTQPGDSSPVPTPAVSTTDAGSTYSSEENPDTTKPSTSSAGSGTIISGTTTSAGTAGTGTGTTTGTTSTSTGYSNTAGGATGTGSATANAATSESNTSSAAKNTGGLAAGAIAGIVIACAVVLAVIVGAVLFHKRSIDRQREENLFADLSDGAGGLETDYAAM